jgi:hypothetical protein
VGGTILSALITVSRRARMEHGLREMYVACSTAIDDAAPYAVLALLAAAFVVVWRERRSGVVDADPPSAAFLAIVWIAASSLLAFYPRMDATHLAFTAPLLYVAAVGLRGRAPASVVSSRAGTDGRRIRRAVDALCLSALLVVFAVKLTPKIASWWTPARDGGILPRPTARISFLSERANVYFPVPAGPQGLPDVESFRELVAYVRRVTTKGEPIFAFPALSMIYFVTGLPNPTRHDYFLGSNVSFREQLEIIRTLERARVKTVVLCDDPADAFVEMAKDFTPVLREYLHGRYYVERRIGTDAVLRAYDTAGH